MQNNKSNPAKMLHEIEPKTKAARIKSIHSLIESKIKAGVQIAQIVAILNEAGLDINAVTLKSYLYRLRRGNRSALPQPTNPINPINPINPTIIPSESSRSTGSSTIQDIDSIIHQDPISQANELAKYERLAKFNRRKT